MFYSSMPVTAVTAVTAKYTPWKFFNFFSRSTFFSKFKIVKIKRRIIGQKRA